MPNQPINIFISYSNNENDRPLMVELVKYLKSNANRELNIWEDGQIIPGEQWDQAIKEKLQQADIVLLLISVDFNNSGYITNTELPLAFSRQKTGDCEIVPIYIRECPFKGQPYADLGMIPQMLHKNKHLTPVTSDEWANQEQAFTAVINQLEKTFELVEEFSARKENQRDEDFSWDSFFSKYPPLPQPQKPHPLITVDCDRVTNYKDKLLFHFRKKNCTNNLQNIVYFISACQTQQPSSLAKRLIYEYDFEYQRTQKGLCFSYFHLNTDGEVAVNDLDFGQEPDTTFQFFWNTVSKMWPESESKYDKFIRKNHIRGSQKVGFIFQIKEKNWESKDVAMHIEHILKRLSEMPEKNQKLVLFFIFTFKNIHSYRAEDCKNYLDSLNKTIQPGENNPDDFPVLHINDLVPVGKTDIETWCEDVIVPKHIDKIIEAMNQETFKKNQNNNQKYDMQIVEEMQYAVYQHLNNRF
jgi:TIR domain